MTTLSVCIVGCNGSHASIHFYPNITAIGCGVGRRGSLMDNTCFKYHPNSNTMFAGIENGRVVQTGETPWTVFITNSLSSGGVILNERWILTCAHGLHCGQNCPVTDIRVYPGLINQSISNHPYYTGGQYFIHPVYELNRWRPWDLALIRLNTALPLDGTSGKTGINAICLPEEMALNVDEEYALLNGFGANKKDGTGYDL
ncbi:unnamed protein product [Medioppia subpectinata]|uniref:Peptidase S1 domain-containing protein n=1 Tax=Medioppia subpectinata TaxID=1979941 RepID=A0A7R9KUQ4_9ACAR|nr:unnamed protein product [Medioppia subpectinata]CAG2108839.1 unnamed protein product [Medioppia subpectinata]